MSTAKNQLSTSETNQGRVFWLEQGLGNRNLSKISTADALAVPLKDFRGGVPFAFHQDTTVLVNFLNQWLGGKATIEILADDEEYLEIALHGAAFRLSTIIVPWIIAPLVINLISSYLYDVLKAKPSDSVEMSIVIENHECRSMQVKFKGEAKDFNSIIDQVTSISHECMTTNHTQELPVMSQKNEGTR